MNCIHNVLTTCSKPSSSHNVWTKGHTWEQTLTHDRSDWNTCTKSRRLQGPNNYYTLWTLQGWRYCSAEGYCKSDEKFLNVKSYQKCKILLRWHYQSHNWVQQSSDTAQTQQIPLVTKTKDYDWLKHLYKIYWLQELNHYYTSKQ